MDISGLPLPSLLIALSCLIIWRASHGFEVASDYLGRKFPPGIKGATINAIASSMPEFLTTLFFLFWLKDADGFSAGLSVASGSALFNLLLIPALAVIVLYSAGHGKKVVLNKRVLLREGLVLLASQVLFIIFLFSGELKALQGLGLVLVYAGYLLLLYMITRSRRKGDPGFRIPLPSRHKSRWLQVATLDITQLTLRGERVTTRNAWALLIFSTLVMTGGTWLLVFGTDRFGEATGVPLIFVAVVLSAVATSVPDTIISFKDARKGNYDDAISNALGSNIFDIAFALGFPILLYDLFNPGFIRLEGEIRAFTQEVWVFLLLATVLALLVMLVGKYFNRLKAWILLFIYILFLLFVGTQVNESLESSIGSDIGHFLTGIAKTIGDFFGP